MHDRHRPIIIGHLSWLKMSSHVSIVTYILFYVHNCQPSFRTTEYTHVHVYTQISISKA